MIKLNNTYFLAEGSHRAVYRHPTDSTKCLKVVKPGSLEKRRQRNKKWYKRLRPLSSFDETHKEVKAYTMLKNQNKSIKHLPKFYGIVSTSKGPAMLLDLIMNTDGSPSHSLTTHLNKGEEVELLKEALSELKKYLITQAIIVRDFAASNIMVQKSGTGTLTLFIVDGLGTSELIPFSRIPFFARLKAKRRVDRFLEKLIRRYPALHLEDLPSVKKEEMIHLDPSLLFSEGATRQCYFHPNDSKKCLKIEKQKNGTNQHDLTAYSTVKNILAHFLVSYDPLLIQTNLGEALVCELLQDDNKQPSKSFADYKKTQKLSPELRSQFFVFFDTLQKNDLFFYDFNPKNFIIKKTLKGDCLKYTDLKSFKKTRTTFSLEFLPYFARKKLCRRIKYFTQKYLIEL